MKQRTAMKGIVLKFYSVIVMLEIDAAQNKIKITAKLARAEPTLALSHFSATLLCHSVTYAHCRGAYLPSVCVVRH